MTDVKYAPVDGDGEDDEANGGLLVDDNTGVVDRPVVETGPIGRGRGKKKKKGKVVAQSGIASPTSPTGALPSTPQLLSARRLVQEAASEWRSMLGEWRWCWCWRCGIFPAAAVVAVQVWSCSPTSCFLLLLVARGLAVNFIVVAAVDMCWRWDTTGGAVCLVVATVCGLVTPALFGHIIDALSSTTGPARLSAIQQSCIDLVGACASEK